MEERIKKYCIVKEDVLEYDFSNHKIYVMLINDDERFQVLLTSRRSELLHCHFDTELEALKVYSVVYAKLKKFHYYDHAIRCARIVSRYKENKEITLAMRFLNSFVTLDKIKKLQRRYGYDITLFFSISISSEDEETRVELSFPGAKSKFGFFAGKIKSELKFYLYN
jgi:hypothetical protein